MSDDWQNDDHQNNWDQGNQENQHEGEGHHHDDPVESHEVESHEEDVEQTPDLEDVQVGDDEEIDTDLRGGGFNWSEVASVAKFAVSYNAKPKEYREFLSDILNSYGSSVEIARSVYPPGYAVGAVDLVGDFVHVMTKDPARIMELTVKIMEHDTETIRAMVSLFNYLVSNYPKDGVDAEDLTIQYRRSMPAMKVLTRMNVMSSSINDDGLERLAWARGILEIWPGVQ